MDFGLKSVRILNPWKETENPDFEHSKGVIKSILSLKLAIMAFNFISIPTEQTTAVTDLILAAQALVCMQYARSRSTDSCFALSLWACVFGLLSFSSLLGAIVHGIELVPVTSRILWGLLYFMLGLLVALIALAALAHVGHDGISKRLVPAGLVVAFVFSAITQVWDNSFLLFVAYEAVMMVMALGIYLACFWLPSKRRGSGWLAIGILFSLVAAAVDTQSALRLHWFWTFDNHGIFHLIQMVGLLIITIGLCQSRVPIANVEKKRCQTMT